MEIDILSQLNTSQREAVACSKESLLVVAGAGSGKTRVITYKIAHLIQEENVPESRILAVTFTNKAAAEMKHRAMSLLERQHLGATICTFHSLCLRILRREAGQLGYGAEFSVCDPGDALSLIKRILEKVGRKNQTAYAPKKIQALISSIKNQSAAQRQLEHVPDIENILTTYDRTLKENDLMDFDDLLLNTVAVLEQSTHTLSHYQSMYPYILVDEFQDTNAIQYRIIRLLAETAIHVCAVGDEDQSIYGWRGANFENMLNFPDDFPGCRVIKLEDNYRSAQNILDVANAVISHNSLRNPKVLHSEIPKTGDLIVFEGQTPQAEAAFIAKQVRALLQQQVPSQDIVILYRTNYLSRTLEDAFRRENIPYRIIGGYKFYERKEVKDILGYLRVIRNPSDNLSFRRIVNVPRRKIGAVTLEKLEQVDPILYNAIGKLPDGFPRKRELQELRNIIDQFRDPGEFTPNLVESLVEEIGYIEMLKSEEDALEAETRMENLSELITVVSDYVKTDLSPSLDGFLDSVSLLSDTDELDNEQNVNLMTIHCAKGLEFDSVFITGLEEGTFPNQRTIGSSRELEEERRLMYVAITRAKRNLYLTFSRERGWKWEASRKKMSRFIREIPVEYLTLNKSTSGGSLSAILSASHSTKPTAPINTSSTGIPLVKKGTSVFHVTYGDGTVLNVVNTDRLVVKFKRTGIKVLNIRAVQIKED